MYTDLSLRFRTDRLTRQRPTLALAAGNYVHDNGDAGMAMLESFNADVSDNIFENNFFGVRFAVGCGHNFFSKNTFSGSKK